MKHLRISLSTIALFVVLSLSVWSAISAQPSTFPARGVVLEIANLRSGPGVDTLVVATVQPGEIVPIAACNGDCTWYQVGVDRWIAAFLVDLNVPEQAITPSITTTSTTTSLLPTVTPQMRAAQNLMPTVTPSPTATVTPTRTVASTGAMANAAANLRGGPGTNSPVVGSTTPGQALEIVGQNEAGDWLQLADGKWIAAFLVDGATDSFAVVATLPTPNVLTTESTPNAEPSAVAESLVPTVTPTPQP